MSKGILKEYFFYQEKYVKLYGIKTIVFMRIGDFFEAYATNNQGYDLAQISEITNLVRTRKDKTIDTVDEKNPYMMGFQHASLHKFLKIMVDSGLTVVVVDQVTPPPNIKREVTGIYSAGTYIGDSEAIDSNNLLSIYIENEKQLDGNYLICIGLSVVDLTTGELTTYEVLSKDEDDKYALDETYRFLLTCRPKEIIITKKRMNHI